jgi:hypothetical protein
LPPRNEYIGGTTPPSSNAVLAINNGANLKPPPPPPGWASTVWTLIAPITTANAAPSLKARIFLPLRKTDFRV